MGVKEGELGAVGAKRMGSSGEGQGGVQRSLRLGPPSGGGGAAPPARSHAAWVHKAAQSRRLPTHTTPPSPHKAVDTLPRRHHHLPRFCARVDRMTPRHPAEMQAV
eukprot:scaffold6332_cov74-Isochrysis_galbana.AAC.2